MMLEMAGDALARYTGRGGGVLVLGGGLNWWRLEGREIFEDAEN